MSITIEAAMTGFLRQRRSRRVGEATIDLYRQRLQLWHAWRAGQQRPNVITSVTADELIDFFIYLAEEHVPHSTHPHRPPAQHAGVAPATSDAYWRTLRSFWVYLESRRPSPIRDEQYGIFRDKLVPRPIVPEGDRPSYMPDDVDLLLRACDSLPLERAALYRALFILLWETGMRISEACSLTDEQIDEHTRYARISGKAHRRRFIFWGPRAAEAIEAYRTLRRGPYGGWLFRSTGSRSSGRPLTDDAVRGMAKRLAAKVGLVLPAGAPIHALRHAYALRLLAQGADISEVSQYLGHKNVETTMIYLRQHPDKLQRRYDQLLGADHP